MGMKAYVCNRYPEIRVGRSRFMGGEYQTADEGEQAVLAKYGPQNRVVERDLPEEDLQIVAEAEHAPPEPPEPDDSERQPGEAEILGLAEGVQVGGAGTEGMKHIRAKSGK